MEVFIELLEKIGVGSSEMRVFFGVVLLGVAVHYIQAFLASQYEAVLMNKSEVSKRFLFVYVVLFFMLGLKNFVFSTDDSFCVVCVIILVLIYPFSWIVKVVYRKRKSPDFYSSFCESRNLVFLMIVTAVVIYVVSAMLNTSGVTDEANMPSVTDRTNLIDMNRLSVVIFGSLVEVFVIAIAFFNTSSLKTIITVMIDDEKWYVFKRIDEEYLLCGKDCKINDSAKARLIKISDIVKNNICFEKEMKETGGEETKAEEAKTEEVKTEERMTKKTKSKKTGKVITVRIRI